MAVGLARAVLLIVPFVLITWLAWARATQQQQHNDRSRTTLAQRNLQLVLQRRRISEAATAVPTVSISASSAAVQAVAASISASVTTATASGAATAIASVPRATAATCSPTRKPYHTILTATAQVYQQWQCRVMYHHWKKQRALDPVGEACTELTGFTRLVANRDGDPDGLEGEIPSYFVKEYGHRDLARFHGYRVINRPYSVVQFLRTPYWKERVTEQYVYVAETDHILLQPLPNRATLGSPMAYVFNYMGPNPAHSSIISRMWPDGGSSGYKRVQPIGPSPVVIHKLDLERIAHEWHETAVALKTDQEADSRLGWVIEMWGYSIAAAKIGLKHQEFADFQVEPGALSHANQLRGFPLRYWLFHYTYQFEYMLDGTPCQPWTIGEFSLDKRHFSDVYPAYPLPQPPPKANPAALYLLNAFNEAMGNISAWPLRQPSAGVGKRPLQTLYGRRRLDWFSHHANGFATELRTMPLVKQLAGTGWLCASAVGAGGGEQRLQLSNSGDASGGLGRGRWGTMNDPTLEPACPVYACLFLDIGGQRHDVKVDRSSDGHAGSLTGLTVMRHTDLATQWTCSPAR